MKADLKAKVTDVVNNCMREICSIEIELYRAKMALELNKTDLRVSNLLDEAYDRLIDAIELINKLQ